MVVSNKDKIIIGIDPGIRNTGWGIIRHFQNKIEHIEHGVIVPEPNENDAIRLHFISINLEKIINKYNPTIAVIEKIFVSASGESALKLGMARGVALNILASKKTIFIKELAARNVKKSLTGTGSADKKQIKFMVEKLLGQSVKKLDASDALAIAIAGFNSLNEKLDPYNLIVNSKNKSINNNLNNAIRRALEKNK